MRSDWGVVSLGEEEEEEEGERMGRSTIQSWRSKGAVYLFVV